MVLLASDFDKSKYLRAEDLQRETKFRIKTVTGETFEQNSQVEKKLVVWFANDTRGLVLNKTNNRTIRGAFGDNTANWVDKIIVIFPTLAEMRGKLTPALRVRIPPPKATAAAEVTTPQLATGSNGAAATVPQSAMSGSGTAAVPSVMASAEMDDEIGF